MDKFGKQEKDEGIQFMRWSLGDSNNDYITYLRGKSNLIQVFDTKTSTIFKEKKYPKLSKIKGMASIGNDIIAIK